MRGGGGKKRWPKRELPAPKKSTPYLRHQRQVLSLHKNSHDSSRNPGFLHIRSFPLTEDPVKLTQMKKLCGASTSSDERIKPIVHFGVKSPKMAHGTTHETKRACPTEGGSLLTPPGHNGIWEGGREGGMVQDKGSDGSQSRQFKTAKIQA